MKNLRERIIISLISPLIIFFISLSEVIEASIGKIALAFPIVIAIICLFVITIDLISLLTSKENLERKVKIVSISNLFAFSILFIISIAQIVIFIVQVAQTIAGSSGFVALPLMSSPVKVGINFLISLFSFIFSATTLVGLNKYSPDYLN